MLRILPPSLSLCSWIRVSNLVATPITLPSLSNEPRAGSNKASRVGSSAAQARKISSSQRNSISFTNMTGFLSNTNDSCSCFFFFRLFRFLGLLILGYGFGWDMKRLVRTGSAIQPCLCAGFLGGCEREMGLLKGGGGEHSAMV